MDSPLAVEPGGDGTNRQRARAEARASFARVGARTEPARLFETGPEITRKEWFYVIAMLLLMVLGTINIRMAEMRERRQGTLPLIDPNLRSRK